MIVFSSVNHPVSFSPPHAALHPKIKNAYGSLACRRLGPQLFADVLDLISLEVTIIRLMKVDRDRHDFADSELAFSKPFASAISK